MLPMDQVSLYRCIVARCLARCPIQIMKICPRPVSGASHHVGSLFLLAAFALLSGCGGGGGGGKTCVDTARGCLEKEAYNSAILDAAEEIRTSPGFEDRWGLEEIGLAEAWGHLRTVRDSGEPGRGVTVGVLDTGIDLDHPTFREGADAGLVTEEFHAGATDETGLEDFSHGTGVASLIAGRENPSGRYQFTGIVPYAALRMFAIPLGSPPPPGTAVSSISLSSLAEYDESEADLYRKVLSHDLNVLNLSFGVIGPIENYRDEAEIRATLGRTIEVLAQSDRENKTILVWAAGNSHGQLCRPGTGSCIGDSETDYLGQPAGLLEASSPDLFAGAMAIIGELQSHSVASVATGEDGEIAWFSNRCGMAADWCIAAPGFQVWAAYFGPHQGQVIQGYARLSGTSFSAPMVSGGLALMKHFFRDQLSSEDLVDRLFETADNTGIYADRSIYGHGLMDLDAALSPYGEPTVIPGASIGATGIPLRESSLQPGAAFGDGPASAFSQQEIAAFDALGAPFWYDLDHLVVPSGLPLLDTQLRDFMAPPPPDRQEDDAEWSGITTRAGMRFDMRRTPAGTSRGHAALPDDAITFTAQRFQGIETTAFTTAGVRENSPPVSGASVSWRPSNSPLGLRAGWLSERSSMLSSTGQGAFGSLAADSVFLGFDLNAETGGWQLGGGPEFGMVRPGLRKGIITGLEPLATSTFEFHASRPIPGAGRLQVSLGQPLRVEAGDAVLSIPTGRTRDGDILRRRLTADLAPTGRQIDLSVRWERPLGAGSLRLGTIATRHAGHNAEARPRLSLLAGWRASF